MKRLRLAIHSPTRLLLEIALVASLLGVQPALAQSDPEISFDPAKGLLTLHVVDAPLGVLLDAIGEAADIEIVKHGEHSAPMTIDLVEVPLQAALTELLGRGNYTMQQDPESGRPLKIWLMSEGDRRSAARIRAAPRPTATPSPGTEQTAPKGEAPDDVRELIKQWFDASTLSAEERAELKAIRKELVEGQIGEELGVTADDRQKLLEMLDDLEAGRDIAIER